MRTSRSVVSGVLVALLAGSVLLALGCGEEGAPVPDEETGAYLPHWLTPDEQADAVRMLRQAAKPAPVTPTVPPTPVLTKPEWNSLQGILIRWPVGWPQLKPAYLAMLPVIQSQGKAYIAVGTKTDKNEAIADIQGCAACSLTNIEWVMARTNSIWMRDFGPEFTYASAQAALSIIDLDYSPTRRLDDAFPGVFASAYKLPIYDPSLALSGGNFQVDGKGNCYTSLHTAELNGEARVRSIFQNYFGCTNTYFIEYLVEEGTHHIDMWMKILSPTTAIVGDYTYYGNEVLAYPDTVNEVKMDNVASMLQGLGFTVVRIPQPPSYMSSLGYYTIRTYTNSTLINDRVMVPVYNLPTDAVALGVYNQLLPSTVQEVGIDSSYIIDYGGAMHCITMEKHP